MSSRNNLPQEIIDMIVAEHEDNISTLRQCTLVSKSFLTPARKLLFNVIELGVDDDDVNSRRLYHRFCDITKANPLILTYVHELCVTDNSSSHDPLDDPRPSWIRDEMDFPEFLVTLVNLQRLILQTDSYWGSLPFALRSTLFAIFHKLDFLALHGINNIPQSVCVALKNVRVLALWAITVSGDEEDQQDVMTSPLASQEARVERLSLQMLQESTPVYVLSALAPPSATLPSLITLSLGPFDEEEVSDDWEVMKASRETLRSFTISYDYRSWNLPPIILEPFNLADFNNLELFSYHVTHSSDQPSTTPFAGLLRLLETLHENNNIHWIFVRVDFPNSVTAVQQLTSYDGWDTLDHQLGETQFKHLEFVHVVIALYALGNGTQVEETIPEELRWLDRDPEHMDNLEDLVYTKLRGVEEADMLSVSIQVVGI